MRSAGVWISDGTEKCARPKGDCARKVENGKLHFARQTNRPRHSSRQSGEQAVAQEDELGRRLLRIGVLLASDGDGLRRAEERQGGIAGSLCELRARGKRLRSRR